MAELTGKAISELTAATSLTDNDLFALSQNGASKKLTVQTLRDKLVRFYNVADLGLTGTPTMTAVAQALPDNSIFIANNGEIDQSELTWPDGSNNPPNVVMIFRDKSYRMMAVAGRAYNGILLTNANLYYAAWDGTAWVGWRKMVTIDAIPDYDSIVNRLNGLDEYIRNKRIAIFGDSLSDEDIQWSTTVNNVWVKSFRTICAPYNPTITNYSRSSRGFCVKDNNGIYTGQEIINNTDFSNIDTVIIFMGVNDFLQGTWFGRPSGTASGQLWTALNAIANKIKYKNVFVITPLFTSSSGRWNTVTLDMYRIALANWAVKNGFMLINGICVPRMFKGSTAFDDGLHIKNAYTNILAKQIFAKMVGGGEPFQCANEMVDVTLSNTSHATGIRLRYRATLTDLTSHFVATATAAVPAGEINLQTVSSVWKYVPINNGNLVWSQIQGNSGSATSPGGSLVVDSACYVEFSDISSAEVLGQNDI